MLNIKAFFNNLFGSNITYIANSYSQSDFIWAIFHNKKTNILFTSTGTTLTIKPESDENQIEYERIPYGNYLKKERGRIQEYLTIVARNRNGSEEIICKNKTILACQSFIVTDKCQVIRSKYGGIWEDEHGIYYFPNKFETKSLI